MTRLERIVRRMGDYLHKDMDEKARGSGWGITKTHWGLRREYRNTTWASMRRDLHYDGDHKEVTL